MEKVKVALSEAADLIGVFDEVVGEIVEALVGHGEARRVLVGCLGYSRAHPGDAPCEGNDISDHQAVLSKARERLDIRLGVLAHFLAADWRSRMLRVFATARYQSARDCVGERWVDISTILGAWQTVAALVDTADGPIDALNQGQIGRIADDRVRAVLAGMTILVALMKNFCEKAGIELD